MPKKKNKKRMQEEIDVNKFGDFFLSVEITTMFDHFRTMTMSTLKSTKTKRTTMIVQENVSERQTTDIVISSSKRLRLTLTPTRTMIMRTKMSARLELSAMKSKNRVRQLEKLRIDVV